MLLSEDLQFQTDTIKELATLASMLTALCLLFTGGEDDPHVAE
jgi:hypothetical protein